MIYIFLAPGFEEGEALVPLDILRRAGQTVQTVGVREKMITGSHGIRVECDITVDEAVPDGLEMVILPGGMPGTRHLQQDAGVGRLVDYAFQNDLWIGAICAAPSVLGSRGLLEGRRATCYPGFESECTGAQMTGGFLEVDGRLVTAKGMGVATEFGLTLAGCLAGEAEAEKIRAAIMCR